MSNTKWHEGEAALAAGANAETTGAADAARREALMQGITSKLLGTVNAPEQAIAVAAGGIADAMMALVAHEREECAKLVECLTYGPGDGERAVLCDAAAAIRKRGKA